MGLARSVDAAGLQLVLDCANGSASAVGPGILAATGARVEVIHDEPDGVEHQRPLRARRIRPSLAEAVVAEPAPTSASRSTATRTG